MYLLEEGRKRTRNERMRRENYGCFSVNKLEDIRKEYVNVIVLGNNVIEKKSK